MPRETLTIERGFTYIQAFQWREESDNTPIDISTFDVKGRFTVGAVTYQLTESSGITITDAVNGIFEVEMSAAQTAAFVEDFGDYEFWVVTPSSKPLPPLLEGALYISS